ncbi:MAG: Uncharacterised protein [Opitutia bacterium UBA7350]|nr:MAG: Uncharacterised protein [Opitutae bacterium UBA7350]
MRKLLYTFYTLLASYPVIFILFVVSVAIVYLGTGYRPIEARYEALLAERIALKQERQRLAQELEGMRQGDLQKRLQIFSNEFLSELETSEKTLVGITNTAFSASGWIIESASIKKEEMPDDTLGLGSIVVTYEGRSQGTTLNDGTAFLPANTLLQACTYLWRKSPTKDFSRIYIERDSRGYRTEMDVIYLIQKAEESEVEE